MEERSSFRASSNEKTRGVVERKVLPGAKLKNNDSVAFKKRWRRFHSVPSVLNVDDSPAAGATRAGSTLREKTVPPKLETWKSSAFHRTPRMTFHSTFDRQSSNG